MTKVDTSQASVERMADRIYNWSKGNGSIEAPAMLRALLAERDELRQALEQARNAALEEAAKVADDYYLIDGNDVIADAIRAYQSTTTKEEE